MFDLCTPGTCTTADAVQNRGTQSCPGGAVEVDCDSEDNVGVFFEGSIEITGFKLRDSELKY